MALTQFYSNLQVTECVACGYTVSKKFCDLWNVMDDVVDGELFEELNVVIDKGFMGTEVKTMYVCPECKTLRVTW